MRWFGISINKVKEEEILRHLKRKVSGDLVDGICRPNRWYLYWPGWKTMVKVTLKGK